MRVKIGNTWYDANDIPIMLELEDKDIENIQNMTKSARKYAIFSEPFSSALTVEEKYQWMDDLRKL